MENEQTEKVDELKQEIVEVKEETKAIIEKVQNSEVQPELKKEMVDEAKKLAGDQISEIKEEIKELKEEQKSDTIIQIPNPGKKDDMDSLIWLLVGILLLAVGYYLFTLNKKQDGKTIETY